MIQKTSTDASFTVVYQWQPHLQVPKGWAAVCMLGYPSDKAQPFVLYVVTCSHFQTLQPTYLVWCKHGDNWKINHAPKKDVTIKMSVHAKLPWSHKINLTSLAFDLLQKFLRGNHQSWWGRGWIFVIQERWSLISCSAWNLAILFYRFI